MDDEHRPDELPPLTPARVEKIVQAACVEGRFQEDFYFEKWPHVTARAMKDRRMIIDAAEKACERLPPRSPARLLLAAAIEEAYAGWPSEPMSHEPK